MTTAKGGRRRVYTSADLRAMGERPGRIAAREQQELDELGYIIGKETAEGIDWAEHARLGCDYWCDHHTATASGSSSVVTRCDNFVLGRCPRLMAKE